ncbi:MAG: aminoacetone oxidase family FAD-binding enzyme [Gammaproteobacteria bacterium]|nr:aminoacetone oxidase family FAD-binding enzyme [Gammaproteobacteria bacterium]
MSDTCDIAIIGAGAAGLMAAIWAAQTSPNAKILVLEGAKKTGAKILVAGGGRCNVTHCEVNAEDYAGGSRNIIKKVLRRFDVAATVAFFKQHGVNLKKEETGKLFPVSDNAHDVLAALLQALQKSNVKLINQYRVQTLIRNDKEFIITGTGNSVHAKKVILATGGKSLPKSGSDGAGYTFAQSLGHSLTPAILPALVPLLLPNTHFLTTLSGLTLPANLSLVNTAGKSVISFTDSLLCAHFGLSGPVVLDVSRYWLAAQHAQDNLNLHINWLPQMTIENFSAALREGGRKTVRNFLKIYLPARLADALCEESGIALEEPCDQLRRDARQRLTNNLFTMTVPITGSRSFTHAEVTAGGIPLTEIDVARMQSRVCPGLFLCGEVCDVDGRIGGFNFQWAWASAYIAGISAAALEAPQN